MEAERILITGAGGVLGTALVELLASQGVPNVTALRRSDCNLLDTDATRKVWNEVKPSIVFHLAAWVAGLQGNLSNGGQAFYENTLINLNVIEASRLAGVRKVVAAGTIAGYSDDVDRPMREIDFFKGRPHSSEEAYAHAKRGLLVHLEAYKKQYGLEFAYMICSNLYGENDRFNEQVGHVVPSLISRFDRTVENGDRRITIWGDGSATRDFVHASDAAAAFLAAARRGHGAYNLASGTSTTIRSLVEALTRVFNFTGEIVWDTSKPSGQVQRSYDVTRLKELGWKPDVSLEDGLRRTAAWFRSNKAHIRL